MRQAMTAALGLMLGAGPLAAEPVAVAEAAFPEGPMVRGDEVIFAQYAGNVVSVWNGEALGTLWEGPGCGPSAVAPLGDDLVVACYDDGTVARLTAAGDQVARYRADATGAPMIGPNDLTPDGRGGLWMTASGPWESAPIVGAVYNVAADGKIVKRADDLHYANGIALSADGTRLYVNESEAGRIISFAVAEDGTLSDRRLVARLSEADPEAGPRAYPDGLKLGPDGNLWVGHYSAPRITVLTPEGGFVAAHVLPGQAAPNLAFSADGSTVWIAVIDDTAAEGYPGHLMRMPRD
jgi:sugar lactone lactonase YvrE